MRGEGDADKPDDDHCPGRGLENRCGGRPYADLDTDAVSFLGATWPQTEIKNARWSPLDSGKFVLIQDIAIDSLGSNW